MSYVPQIVTLLNGVTATGEGAAQSVRASQVTYQVSGITTATVKIEVSLDGTVWYQAASVTADGGGTIAGNWKKVRANVTAYTSGTILVKASV